MNEAAPTEGDDFAAALVAQALRKGASAAQARTSKTRYMEMQFDNRGVDLVRTTENQVATITVFRDGKRGAATLNSQAPEEIAAALDAALIAADAGLPDPANDVAEAISEPASRHGPDAEDRERMGASIEAFRTRLAAEFPLIRTRDCLYSFSDVESSFANSRGVRQNERSASYGFGALFMAKDGLKTTSMNYSGAGSFTPFENLFDAGSVERLLRETSQSLDRKPVPEKFQGDVIVTPDCLHSLLGSIIGALSGPALFAGTTPFKDKRGEAIASPLFSLSNRPRDPLSPGRADFDSYGVPTQDLEVIGNGVLNEFLVDFFFSKKLGVPQTAGAYNFSVAAGESPLKEIIANTKRGILFSRFSGGSPNNNLDFSGVAKNSFYIEDGAVRHAIDETMVSGNFQELLKNIRAISQESVNFGAGSFPYLAASDVTISSK